MFLEKHIDSIEYDEFNNDLIVSLELSEVLSNVLDYHTLTGRLSDFINFVRVEHPKVFKCCESRIWIDDDRDEGHYEADCHIETLMDEIQMYHKGIVTDFINL